MKFVSWNVNGLRACMNKGFLDTFYELNADFFCLQETKLQAGQIALDLPGYEQYWCYAEKKGYSGTAIFTKHTPQSVSYGLGVPELDTEGRLITLEYPEFYLVTCYTPNAQRGLARIEHRLKWEEDFRGYLKELDSKKPVILCGDLNVAHKEIDLKNPGSNRGNAGFSDEERGAFSQLLSSGFTDTFRHLYPDKTGAYSWWSYMFNARANNAGWRIDYFVVSDRLRDTIHDATIHPEYFGSDHCPVGLDLNITCNGGIWSPETERPADKNKKEADGDSPAGPVLKISITIALLAALVLLVPNLIPRQTDPMPYAPEPTQTQATQIKLINEVIDRSESASYMNSAGDPLSSSLTSMITDGDERWILYEQQVIQSSVKYQPLFVSTRANFFVQVDFTDAYAYPPNFQPGAEISVNGSADAYVLQSYYYEYPDHTVNGIVSGFFIYGYSPDPLELDITVTYLNINSPQNDLLSEEISISIDPKTDATIDISPAVPTPQ